MARDTVAIFSLLTLAAAWYGCGREAEQPGAKQPLEHSLHALQAETTVFEIPWGGQQGELGRRPAGLESVARGPESIAATGNGEVALLDAVKGRVALFDKTGSYLRAVDVDPMARDFAPEKDGGFASLNLAAMRIERRDGEGKVRGEIDLSPAFKTAVGLDYVPGEGLELSTMYQETYSADAVEPLASVREGLRGAEGSFKSLVLGRPHKAAGSGVVVVLEAIEAKLKGAGEATRVAASFPTECSALRLLGILKYGELAVVCDTATDVDGVVDVERSLQLLSPDGEKLFAMAVSTATDYAPFRAYRVSGAALLAMAPGPSGLKVSVVSLSRGGAK